MTRKLITGMADGDGRRHLYDVSGKPRRYCDGVSGFHYFVAMPKIKPDCKRCLDKKRREVSHD